MTYKCDNCWGTFDGSGAYVTYNWRFCPACTLIKQQEKQYEEQRRVDRERQEREEKDRRLREIDMRWEREERQRKNHVSNNFSIDSMSDERFEAFLKIFEKKLADNGFIVEYSRVDKNTAPSVSAPVTPARVPTPPPAPTPAPTPAPRPAQSPTPVQSNPVVIEKPTLWDNISPIFSCCGVFWISFLMATIMTAFIGDFSQPLRGILVDYSATIFFTYLGINIFWGAIKYIENIF